jgi:adenine-specific DNA methylase
MQGMQQPHEIPSATADYRISHWTKCKCEAGFITGLVLDPFAGFNTTGAVALRLGRDFLSIDLDPLNVRAGIKRVEPYLQQVRVI